jgi:hypothetical protein
MRITLSTIARALLIAAGLLVAVVIAALVLAPLLWQLNLLRAPEIVRGSSAGGGLWGACPLPKESGIEVGAPEALSPEFNARLATRFPPGSAEQGLIGALKKEGFGAPSVCELDRSIKWVSYNLDGDTMVAEAYWKADPVGKIIWTEGYVAYTFL